MLKAIAFVLKASIFAVVVLVLGNWVRWDGKTISDQIRSRMASAEHIAPPGMKQIRSIGDRISTGAAKAQSARTEKSSVSRASEGISPTERQKLRSLIQELNSEPPQDVSRRR